jgi:predicted RNA-binding protein YlqC (UPF0109 family)
MSVGHTDTDRVSSGRALSELIIGVVSTITRSCVRSPDLIEVDYDARKHRVMISAAPKDRGVLIGRDGKNLRALEDALTLALTYHSGARSAGSQELPLIELKGKRESSRENGQSERRSSSTRSDTAE